MEEKRKRPKEIKAILIAVIAIILVVVICFLSQCDALKSTSDMCALCCSREPTKGKYCDVCFEAVQNIGENSENTP